MPFPFLPIAVAGASAFFAHKGQADANRANILEAQKQRDFQERMSGSSYQRGMKDMRLAGLNPMLAFSQGGASTPGGAKAEVASTLGPAVNSALAVRRMEAEISAIGAGIDRTRAETEQIRGRPGRALEPLVDYGSGLVREFTSGLPNVIPRIMRGMERTRDFTVSSARRLRDLLEQTLSGLRRSRLPATIGPDVTRTRR